MSDSGVPKVSVSCNAITSDSIIRTAINKHVLIGFWHGTSNWRKQSGNYHVKYWTNRVDGKFFDPLGFGHGHLIRY